MAEGREHIDGLNSEMGMSELYKDVEITCTSAQKRAITAEIQQNSLINIISGPGTGKTKTLCDRIAYLLSTGIKPNEILVFSLANQPVNEFKITLCNLIGEELASDIQISTIHSFANSILMATSSYWQIIRDKKTIDPVILNDILLSLSSKMGPLSNESLPSMKSYELLSLRKSDPELYKKYLSLNYSGKKSLLRNESILYDKIIYEATQILNDYNNQHDVTNGYNVPYPVLEAKEIIIDEFQDISYLLLDFILALSKNKQLTISGDIDQSVYGFSGATPDYNIKKIIPCYKSEGYDLREFILDETFRYSENIHKLSLNLLEKTNSLITKCVDENPVPVVRREFQNVVDEYEFIFNEIHSLIENSNGYLTPKNFAILSFTNRSLNDFQVYFDNKKSPYYSKRLVPHQPWLETKISTIISFLKILDDPNNDPCLLVALSFINTIGPSSISKIKSCAEAENKSIYEYLRSSPKLQKRIGGNSIEDLNKIISKLDRSDPSSIIVSLTCICQLFNYSKQLSTDSLIQSYNTFLQNLYNNFKTVSIIQGSDTDLVRYFLDNYQSEFLKGSNLETKDIEFADEYVTLSTIHSAKGLQWDIVFIMSNLNLTENIQSVNSRTSYVAVTRARHLLYFNKSFYDNEIYIDTADKRLAEKNIIKTIKSKTISDYIPDLNKYSQLNDLNELPKLGYPIGIENDKKLLANLISNIHKRKISKLPVNILPLNKNITRLSKVL